MAELTAEERFWARVRKTQTCWVWTGSVTEKGYGNMPLGRRAAKCYTHRWSYEHFVGPIPDGMEIDHTCHDPDVCRPADPNDCPHRRCVNPEHLEVVTRGENCRRGKTGWGAHHRAKTHCPTGHPYDENNTRIYITPAGIRARICRTCQRDAMRRHRAHRASGGTPVEDANVVRLGG